MVALTKSDVASPKNCFDFRVGLEGEAAAAAARVRTDEDLALLARTLNEMEGLRTGGQLGLDEDFAFHLQVARASHNDYFVSALQSLRESIYDGMLLARTASYVVLEEKMAAINTQHRLVYEAIRDRNAEAARTAMRQHLLRCKKSTRHWYPTGNDLDRDLYDQAL